MTLVRNKWTKKQP